MSLSFIFHFTKLSSLRYHNDEPELRTEMDNNYHTRTRTKNFKKLEDKNVNPHYYVGIVSQ